MIRLENVSHFYGHGSTSKCVLDRVSCVLDTSHNIGILGLNGAGKSTLLRIIGGGTAPSSGRVYRDVSVSWPLGMEGFNGSLTGEENLRFVSRIYGADRHAVHRFVADFAELREDLYRPVRTYSSGMKSRLSLALSLAIHFDVYLIDEGLSVGDVRFQERYSDAIHHRFKESRVIIVSHSMDTIRNYCSHAAVLYDARMSNVVPLEHAIAIYDRVAKEETKDRR
jgi:capsular polysaccharide transport system ATP-binding protein